MLLCDIISWNNHPKIFNLSMAGETVFASISFRFCYRLAICAWHFFFHTISPHWNTRGQLLKIVIPFVRFHIWNAVYTTQSPPKNTKNRVRAHKIPVVNPTEMQLFNHFLFHRLHGRNTFVCFIKIYAITYTVYDLRLTKWIYYLKCILTAHGTFALLF